MSAADKIKVIDTDGDGVLTAEEHARGSRVMFEKMDIDKDGFLTKDELAAGHAGMMKKPSADGAISREVGMAECNLTVSRQVGRYTQEEL